MSAVVLVHGIAQQTGGPDTLLNTWRPALRDGVTLAGGDHPLDDVAMAFYGDVFRPAGGRAVGAPLLTAGDVADPIDRELLLTWWAEAARTDPAVPGPNTATRVRTPHLVQRALHALSHSPFFAGLAEHLLIGALAQVRRYLTEDDLRERIQDRLLTHVSDHTRVVVAHSLGTVIAYEALHRIAGPRNLTLVTLGSPLGTPNLIFDRLRPAPRAGRGAWPSRVGAWTNIADRADIVALVKTLANRFPGDLADLADLPVHNGAQAHDVRPYLTAAQTGSAVLAGLNSSGIGAGSS
jgi:hypothetical protein